MKKVIASLSVFIISNSVAMNKEEGHIAFRPQGGNGVTPLAFAQELGEPQSQEKRALTLDEILAMPGISRPRRMHESYDNGCELDPALIPSDILAKAVRFVKRGQGAE